jgi:hypothetical protein
MELYARDIRREPGMDKLPPMARLDLYPGSVLEARSRFPSLPPQTVASIEQATSKKYRRRRYEVIWTGVHRFRTTAPRFRPVHNQSWSALILNGRPVVSLRLGEAWVRLNNGPQFHRQMQSLRAIACGDAAPAELAVYEPTTAPADLSSATHWRCWAPEPQIYRMTRWTCVSSARSAIRSFSASLRLLILCST